MVRVCVLITLLVNNGQRLTSPIVPICKWNGDGWIRVSACSDGIAAFSAPAMGHSRRKRVSFGLFNMLIFRSGIKLKVFDESYLNGSVHFVSGPWDKFSGQV
jgi:hypothetical protein